MTELSEETRRRFPNLSKLGIAILEHLVEKAIGESAIEEVKKPYAEKEIANSLGQALEKVEANFIDQYEDQHVKDALLQLPIHNLPSILDAIWVFYKRPNDHGFENQLVAQLKTIKSLKGDQIKLAVDTYMGLLRRELVNFDELREKIQALVLIEIADTLGEVKEILAQKDEHGGEKKRISKKDGLINAQLIVDGNISDFNEEKRGEIIKILAALLHTDEKSIKVFSVSEGSIVLELEMEEKAFERLCLLIGNGDFRLKQLKIIAIRTDNSDEISFGKNRDRDVLGEKTKVAKSRGILVRDMSYKMTKRRPSQLNVLIVQVIGIFSFIVASLLGTLWIVPRAQTWWSSRHSTPTATPHIPTYTLPPFLTLTFTLSPSPIPSLTQTTSAPLFWDNFDNNTRNYWNLPDSSDGAYVDARIVGGKLTLVIECPSTYESSFCNPYIVVPNFSGNNFNLTFDSSLEKLSGSTANASINIMFRYKSGNYYAANYNFDGKYYFELFFGGKPNTIQSGYIGLAPDITNHIGLLAHGKIFNMLVNDQFISVEDGNIPDPGIMSLYFMVYKGSKIKIIIDNFYIYPLVP